MTGEKVAKFLILVSIYIKTVELPPSIFILSHCIMYHHIFKVLTGVYSCIYHFYLAFLYSYQPTVHKNST